MTPQRLTVVLPACHFMLFAFDLAQLRPAEQSRRINSTDGRTIKL